MRSVIKERKLSVGNRVITLKTEEYVSAKRMVEDLKERKKTSDRFDDYKSKYSSHDSWAGASYSEALDMLENGYQPTVDELKKSMKQSLKKVSSNRKRISFKQDVVGFQPIVPLALMNVPDSMLDVDFKVIKSKVLDIYYDIGCSASVDSDDIIELGQNLLSFIIEMELQGFKINLYVTDAYCDSGDIDMVVVKVKTSNQALDIKRISYPVSHTSFFRVLGFDWYSKFPKGEYKPCLGVPLDCEIKKDEIKEFTKHAFGDNAITIFADKIIKKTRSSSNKKEAQTNMIKEALNGQMDYL